MIVTRLLGGLGNQMFQYAVGRALALQRAADLYLDCSWYEQSHPGSTPRRYELHHLQTVQRFAGRFVRWKFRQARQKRSLFLRQYAYVEQPSRSFDARLLELQKRHVYLDGYWQCEHYFSSVRSSLLRDFRLVSEATGQNAELLAEIAECNAVALHVRRGDYVQNEHTHNVHGTCSLEYYRDAVAYILARVARPRFFVFSDEPDWVRRNLQIEAEVRHISHNHPDLGHEDLRLMAHCKHFIIANSSFSWWGAWLSTHADKLVLAPRRWFADPGRDEGDIVPTSWIRV
jgi:hypothetical protein